MKTARRRSNASAPLRDILKNYILDINAFTLDYGCGYGEDVRYLRHLGMPWVQGIDVDPDVWPHGRGSVPDQFTYDCILCTYVLDSVDQESERHILNDIWDLLDDGGMAFFSVRRGSKNRESHRMSKPSHPKMKSAIHRKGRYEIYCMSKEGRA